MPYYNRDSKRDPNFDNHPHAQGAPLLDPKMGSCQNYGPFFPNFDLKVRLFWTLDFPLSFFTGYMLPGDVVELRPEKAQRDPSVL